MDIVSDIIRIYNLTANFLFLWLLQSDSSLFRKGLSALEVGPIHCDWAPQPHFDWLWSSVMVFIYGKEKFP